MRRRGANIYVMITQIFLGVQNNSSAKFRLFLTVTLLMTSKFKERIHVEAGIEKVRAQEYKDERLCTFQ